MADPSLMGFLGEHAGSAAVSAIVSAIVSYIGSKLSDRRQKNARQREAIDQLVEQISENAVCYWRSVGIDVSLEKRLIADLEKLEERIDLHLPKFDAQSLKSKIDRITQWVTGGDFQSFGRVADRGRAQTIQAELRELRKLIC